MVDDSLGLLIVEDNPDDAELMMLGLVRSGLVVHWRRVETEVELRSACNDASWDAVLCDIRMPRLTPYRVLEVVGELIGDLPVVMVSGTVQEREALSLLRAGARDFFAKDSLERLPFALHREVLDHRSRQRRQKAEESLREERSRLQAITAALAEGLFVTDLEGRITDINPAALTMLGWRQEEVVGRLAHPLFHHSRPDGSPYPRQECPLCSCLERGRVIHDDAAFFWRRDGTGFPVAFTAAPLLREGRSQGGVAIFRDVTEIREAQEALAHQAFQLGERVKEAECLREITRLTLTPGWSEDEILEACVQRIPHGWLDPGRTRARIRLGERLFTSSPFQETPTALSAPIPLPPGEEGVVEVFLIRGAGPELSFLDEERLLIGSIARQLGQSLERLRAEEALHRAKEAAEEASRAKSDFLSAMSHEIRTPMNVVVGMGEVLLETGLTDEQRGYVERLQSAGTNLLELINQILDFARIEAGRLEILHEPLEVRPLVANVAGLLQLMAAGKGLELTTAVAAGVPRWVSGDGLRLRQVLVNLLGNAIKFTDQGRVALEVGVESGGGEGARLRFQVEDTGVGIGPEHLEAIFDSFTQADGGITRRYGGSGLGLSLSRQLVELMGGTIRVESRAGEGSTFHVVLPLIPATPLPSTPTPAGVVPAVEGRSLAILLVEDSDDNQLLIRTFLKSTPHRLEVVGDGEAAVQRVREGGFDLVLMDVQMPIMDGYTATRAIRSWERETGRPPLTIVALNAHALEGEAQRSREAGCDLYLAKPIRKQRLLAVIREVGGGSPTGGG